MIDVTAQLSTFAVMSDVDDVPSPVKKEATRALVNWVGCALGGCREPATEIALATAMDLSGKAEATVIGRSERLDLVSAAEINCLSSSVHAYDDTHLATVTHPTGPVAAAILALAERQKVSGKEFLHALILGIEIECRLAAMLTVSPAHCNLGFYMTGLTGAIGAAAAAGRLLGLDCERMINALGIGSIQGAGFRETHATMCSGLVPALAARNGLFAALLSARGFTCSPRSLESAKGFAGVFGTPSNPLAAVAGLGEGYNLLATTYKPYPCGIVIHPTIDACLNIASDNQFQSIDVVQVKLEVHPLALDLTGLKLPRTGLEAQISIFHWAAAALLYRRATLIEAGDACVCDPRTIALRSRVVASRNAEVAREEASAEVVLRDGTRFHSHIRACRGSVERPMTDPELDAKFMAQALHILPRNQSIELLALCRGIEILEDVGPSFRNAAALARVSQHG